MLEIAYAVTSNLPLARQEKLMFKQWRIALILTIVIAFGVIITACGQSSSSNGSSSTPAATAGGNTPAAGPLTPTGEYVCVQGSITAAGSTALQPLASNVAKDYQGRCQGASITVNGGGSGTGLTQVEAGQVQIGNSDVFAKPEQTGLADHHVAVVTFAIILNSKVTGVTNLTTAQLQGIYSGKTTNWKEVGGPDMPIVVVTRPASSGTRQTFENYVLGGKETVSGPSNLQTDSTGAVLTNVRQTPGAIGYVTLGASKGQEGIVTVNIDGKEPTADNTKNDSYKFWNIEHMYTNGPATGLPQAFINYMGSDQAKAEMDKLDFIPIAAMDPTALASHTK